MKSVVWPLWVAAFSPSTGSADGLDPLFLLTLVWKDVNKLKTKEKQFESSVFNDPSLMIPTCEEKLGTLCQLAPPAVWHRGESWSLLIQPIIYIFHIVYSDIGKI